MRSITLEIHGFDFLMFIFNPMIFKKKIDPSLRKKAVYMWNIKPDEKSAIPIKNIEKNKRYFDPTIIEAKQVEELVVKMDDEVLTKLWKRIPWWIVKADLGRLLYVYLNGGFYFDVDCKVRKNFLKESENKMVVFIEKKVRSLGELGPRETKIEDHKLRIANYGFGAHQKKHPFLKEAIEECKRRLALILKEGHSEINELDVVWLCGPDVITSVYHKHKTKHKDLLLLDKKNLDHQSFGGWRM